MGAPTATLDEDHTVGARRARSRELAHTLFGGNQWPNRVACHVPRPVLEDGEGTITLAEHRRRTEAGR